MTATASSLVPLVAAVQNYAWGLTPPSDSFVARLHALNASAAVDPSKPYAELWIGVHPSAPAALANSPDTTLPAYLSANALTPLPYLLKVLSVAKPLSIQAHPDKTLAARLHADNPKAYKDDNHKPEMCVALTDFEGMCNFRPIADIHSSLLAHPELAALCGGQSVLTALSSATSSDEKKAALRTAFTALMTADDDAVSAALSAISGRLSTTPPKNFSPEALFIRLLAFYPGDVGAFSAFLLNHVRLTAGQSFFMAANEPHAYLTGQIVEIMANSDNVVRAGLTPKFKDVPNLVQMLTYEDGPPTISPGETIDERQTLYRPPVNEFQLTKCVLPAGETMRLSPAKGPGLILCLGGSGWIGIPEGPGGEIGSRMPLAPGSVYYVADEKEVVVLADQPVVSSGSAPDLFFFRAGVNEH